VRGSGGVGKSRSFVTNEEGKSEKDASLREKGSGRERSLGQKNYQRGLLCAEKGGMITGREGLRSRGQLITSDQVQGKITLRHFVTGPRKGVLVNWGYNGRRVNLKKWPEFFIGRTEVEESVLKTI